MNTNILITGMGHSGTRLLVQLFQKIDKVYVPQELLNQVGEYQKLHKFFTECADKTSLEDNDWNIDKEKLFFILDGYYSLNKDKKITVIKLPYYPLRCINFFKEYFNNKLVILYCDKNFETIFNSFIKRNEVNKFMDDPIEMIRQTKKIDTKFRFEYLNSKKSFIEKKNFFHEYYKKTISLKNKITGINLYTINTEDKINFQNDVIAFFKKENIDIKFSKETFDLFNKDKKRKLVFKKIFTNILRKI